VRIVAFTAGGTVVPQMDTKAIHLHFICEETKKQPTHTHTQNPKQTKLLTDVTSTERSSARGRSDEVYRTHGAHGESVDAVVLVVALGTALATAAHQLLAANAER